jgi:Ca2+/Na+ antiporter
MKNRSVEKEVGRRLKPFWICVFIYAWFEFMVLTDGEFDVLEKAVWCEFLMLLCVGTLYVVKVIVRIEMAIEDGQTNEQKTENVLNSTKQKQWKLSCLSENKRLKR